MFSHPQIPEIVKQDPPKNGLEINARIHLHWLSKPLQSNTFSATIAYDIWGHLLSSETTASRKTLQIMQPETKEVAIPSMIAMGATVNQHWALLKVVPTSEN